jgi:hypothetical protein
MRLSEEIGHKVALVTTCWPETDFLVMGYELVSLSCDGLLSN